MPEQPKYCRDCAHVFTLEGQTYKRCRLSGAAERDEASLCGMMRRDACKDGQLFEKKA